MRSIFTVISKDVAYRNYVETNDDTEPRLQTFTFNFSYKKALIMLNYNKILGYILIYIVKPRKTRIVWFLYVICFSFLMFLITLR